MRFFSNQILPSVFLDNFFKNSNKIIPATLQLPPPTTQCSSENASTRIAVYESVLKACSETPLSTLNCSVRDSVFSIEGFAEPIHAEKELGHGTFGFVYKTNLPNIVVKSGSVCVDKAVMEALKDVDDPIIPKEFKIISQLSPMCRSNTLVMSMIGEKDWFELMSYRGKSVPIKEGYTRIYRMLSALKKYHSLGFAHGDFHERNIRIKEHDPMFIGIIDLGASKPITKGEKYPEEFFRDLIYVAESIRNFVLAHKTEELTDWIIDGMDFFASTEPVIGECVNYDLWIWAFDQLANSNIPDINNRIRELIIPTFFPIFLNLINRKIANAVNKNSSVYVLKFPKSFRPPITDQFRTASNRPIKKILPQISDILTQQKLVDETYPETRPYLALDSELIYERSAVTGELEARVIAVGHNMEVGKNSCVYFVPNYKVEYRVNCDDLDGDLIDMQREFGMMKIGAEIGICYNAIWMSPPVKLPFWNSSKLLLEKSTGECNQDPRSHVRYMVTEHWDDTLEKSGWRLNIKEPIERIDMGLKFAIFFVKKFKQLHRNHQIVYGRLSPKHIAFKEKKGEYFFKLDEFGKSFFNSEFSSECDGCDYRPSAEPDSNPCYQTHWNLNGSRLAFRDDILNVLLVTAWIMSLVNRAQNFCSLKSSSVQEKVAIENWKKNDFVFGDIFSTIGGDEAEVVTGALQAALETARSVSSVDDFPDHDLILLNLESALLAIREKV